MLLPHDCMDIHMFNKGKKTVNNKGGGGGLFRITSACGRTNKELVFNQCCLNFPLINAIVTR